ncbi:MAG TPA: hypothetical protein VH082_04425 [Rudaea sp.]|jgi:hypothetical protein|nr:hypothetical protein [Rudaea sp.]
MSFRFRWPILALAGFTSASVAADWSVRVTPFGGIYPSLELSQARRTSAAPETYTLGAGSGLIAVVLTSRRAGERVVVTTRIPEFDRTQRLDADLAQATHRYELYPPLQWNDALQSQKKPVPAHIEFSLERDGMPSGTREERVTIHPFDEALYFVRDGAETVDLSWIFAAYVDENDAVVDDIIDRAKASGIVDDFNGYARGSSDAVLAQAWAIWHAISERGIRYSSADPSIQRGPHVFSQHVRLLSETWNDRSANCIDGSVLIASVLQRVGIRSFLVLVPGHAFLGFYTDADAQHAAYLETTLLGANVATASNSPSFARDVAITPETQKSRASFTAALAAGRAHHMRVAAKLDGRHAPDYAVIDIAAAREFGIRPISAPSETK